MNDKERIAELEAENKRLRDENQKIKSQWRGFVHRLREYSRSYFEQSTGDKQ